MQQRERQKIDEKERMNRVVVDCVVYLDPTMQGILEIEDGWIRDRLALLQMWVSCGRECLK